MHRQSASWKRIICAAIINRHGKSSAAKTRSMESGLKIAIFKRSTRRQADKNRLVLPREPNLVFYRKRARRAVNGVLPKKYL